MVASLQEKEQDLLAQNEELIAQQDELHAQQLELQEALEIVKGNEVRLSSRNELINKIANSLDKQEVLESVVMNMCPIIGADKGIIAFIDEDAYASYGISTEGIKQFRANLLFSGIVERLQVDREPFIVKRDSSENEKGFHTKMLNMNDLYLPIFLSGKKLIAVMAFSRSKAPFEMKRMEEYEAFAKNIGIALKAKRLERKSRAPFNRQPMRIYGCDSSIRDIIRLTVFSRGGAVWQTTRSFYSQGQCEQIARKRRSFFRKKKSRMKK